MSCNYRPTCYLLGDYIEERRNLNTLRNCAEQNFLCGPEGVRGGNEKRQKWTCWRVRKMVVDKNIIWEYSTAGVVLLRLLLHVAWLAGWLLYPAVVVMFGWMNVRRSWFCFLNNYNYYWFFAFFCCCYSLTLPRAPPCINLVNSTNIISRVVSRQVACACTYYRYSSFFEHFLDAITPSTTAPSTTAKGGWTLWPSFFCVTPAVAPTCCAEVGGVDWRCPEYLMG